MDSPIIPLLEEAEWHSSPLRWRRSTPNQDAALKRLFSLVAIPSVSTDPAYAGACLKAAEWLKDELAGLGFEATVRPTAGHPMVVAHARAGRPGAPHVLFYGHYDVQPADPLDLWKTPPFEPRLAEAPTGPQIVGRGTSDDKGQLMTFVEACRALRADRRPPLRHHHSLRGRGGIGLALLPAFLAENKAELHADVALICDTGMLDRTTPAVTTMLRGIVTKNRHQGRRSRPSFRPVRRRRGQSDPCAGEDHRRSA